VKTVIETLRRCGYANWQIARALAVIQNGGTVQEAEAALHHMPPAAFAALDASLLEVAAAHGVGVLDLLDTRVREEMLV
jgi:hypothetical protein